MGDIKNSAKERKYQTLAHASFPSSFSPKFVTGVGILLQKPMQNGKVKNRFHWWVSDLLLADVILLFAALDMNTVNE